MLTEKSSKGLLKITTQLEVKIKEINETRQTINKIKSLEDFYAFRLKISQSFFELDQEIREILQNIKDFRLQMKELISEKQFSDLKYKNLEDKYLNSVKYNEELKKNNRELVFQINLQQEEIFKNENLVLTLTENQKKIEVANNMNENTNRSKNEALSAKIINSTSDAVNKNNNVFINKSNFNSVIAIKEIKEDEKIDVNDIMENSKKILDANFAKSMDDNIELVQSKRINKSNRDITAAKENSNSQETYNLPRENRNLNFKLYKYEDKREIAGKSSIEFGQHVSNLDSLDNLVVENYKNLPNKENSERKSKINQDSIHAENYFNEEKTTENFSPIKSNKEKIPIKKSNSIENSISKPERVYNIILKIKTCPDASVIISQLFGKKIIERLMSPDIELELIEEIEKIIEDISELKIRGGNKTIQEKDETYYLVDNNEKKQMNSNFVDKEDNKNEVFFYKNKYPVNFNKDNNSHKSNDRNKFINQNNYEQEENHKERIMPTNSSANKIINSTTNPNFNLLHSLNSTKFSNNFIKENTFIHNRTRSNRSLNKSYSKVSKNTLDNFKIDTWEKPKFEGILRNYGKGNLISGGKIFYNYCSKASGFFDAPLQKGGSSKLKTDSKLRSKSTNKILNNNNVVNINNSSGRSLYDRSFVSSYNL